ncbi:Endo-1,4-beta-xylanase [Bacillus velezensis]|nr:Endo-1,4-beta-xylanase [Bacillus velezensis]
MFKFKKKFLVGLTAAFMSISMFSATASAAGTDYWQIGLTGAEQ